MAGLFNRDSDDSRVPGEEHATARQIARIASQLFAERGVDGTSVRSIADAAGVTCPTLYYHFGSKEGLAHELATRPLIRLLRVVRDLAEDGSLDPIARLARIVDAYLSLSRERPEGSRLIYAVLFGPSDKALQAEIDGYFLSLNELLSGAVSQLADAGIVLPERVNGLSTALRGLIIIQSINFLYRGGNLGPELAGRIVRDLLLGFAEPDAQISLLSRCFTREATRPGADPLGPGEGTHPGEHGP